MKQIHQVLLAFILCVSFFMDAQEKQPNIVYILADDLGIGDISGLNPESKISTPNIDTLMKEGMTFTDAHTASAVCTPTRYGIITGRYAWRTQLKKKVLDGYSQSMINDSTDTAPALLQRYGYTTAMIGKWHLGWNWSIENEANLPRIEEVSYKFAKTPNVDYSKPFTKGPTDKGFDYFYGINASLDFPPYTYSKNNLVTVIPSEIKERQGRRNDFPGGRKKDLEGGQIMMRKGDKAENFDPNETLKNLTSHAVDYIKNYNSNKPLFLYVPLTAPHTPVLPRKEFLGKSKAGIYGDFVQETDWSVGLILKALKDKGLEDNTLVIFTADNGASKISFPVEFEKKYNHKPSRELRGRKASLFRGGHLVPFVAKWPSVIKANTTNSYNISLNDLYATCASIVNIEPDPNQGVDSYSILTLLKGENTYNREVSIYSDFGGRFSIRKGDFKLDMNVAKKKNNLFNVIEDPSEKNNLFNDEKFTDIREDLIKSLNETILNGRSTKGPKLKNEGETIWDELFWMKTKN